MGISEIDRVRHHPLGRKLLYALYLSIPLKFREEKEEEDPDRTMVDLIILYNDEPAVQRQEVIEWYERAKLLL